MACACCYGLHGLLLSGMVDGGGSPYPSSNLTMPSPGARPWPGSPSVPGPSPVSSSRHAMAHSPGHLALHSPHGKLHSFPNTRRQLVALHPTATNRVWHSYGFWCRRQTRSSPNSAHGTLTEVWPLATHGLPLHWWSGFQSWLIEVHRHVSLCRLPSVFCLYRTPLHLFASVSGGMGDSH